MSRSRSIPEELIKLKANEIWKKRLREGREGDSESDWFKAKKYLQKHRWQVVLWRLNKLWKLIKRKLRVFAN